MPVLALFLFIQQAAFFTRSDLMQSVDLVRTAGWLLFSAVVLAALLTGGLWFKPREVRELMNDEVTRANRAEALGAGFTVAMFAGILLYGADSFAPGPVDLRDGIHLIVSAGLATALLRFGLLERRALA
ncbi:MAG TPA: hypothetical protein VI168_05385 [Croceibacterium sp.]